jgi:DNA-directed RNA polymerase sigma subunit (sigma70/sigma32)
MIKEVQSEIPKKYLAAKSSLTLRPRYFEVFEFMYGIIDGELHPPKECAEHFGVSTTRIRQLEARVLDALEDFDASGTFSPREEII